MHLREIRAQLKEEGNEILLRPEVMGKGSQFGNLEETLNLSADIEGIAPCLDFSHWHARTGEANSRAEFASVLDQVEKRLDRQALDNMHIHVSGIAYGSKGEIKHLALDESDFRYMELMKALKERRVQGVVICESPNLEEDALLLQQTYLGLRV
jgi:deoxyribonuclease-4